MKHTIRRMRFEEIPKASALLKASYKFLVDAEGLPQEMAEELWEERGSPESIEEQLNEYTFYVLDRESTLAGVLALQENEITKLFVAPEMLRLGFGSALFEIAQRQATRAGYDLLVVGTTDHAIPFFEAMGMKVTEIIEADEGVMLGRKFTILQKPLMGSNTTRRLGPEARVHL